MPVLRFLFSKDQDATKLKSGSHGVGEWFSLVYDSFLNWFANLALGEPYKALAYLSIGLVVITVFKNISRFTAMNFMVLIRNKSVRKMRLDIYEKCLKLPIAFFNNERKGDLISRMSNDIKEIEFALKTKVSCDKNHVTGVTAKGTIVSTAHGFIKNSPNEINKYKKEHSKNWASILGSDDFDIVEE